VGSQADAPWDGKTVTGLHCDFCEILLTGDEVRRAPDGCCPRCQRPMQKTRPVSDADRAEIVRLIREGKVRVEGEEEQN
jgi:uncharacterized paraquat-inducible protein A